jgi:hypothetical protein
MPLPIPASPAPPIGAAIAYGARQSYERDREFSLQAQQVAANIAAQQQQAQLRQQQARQEAYQFEANKFLQAQQMQQRAYEFDVGADLDYARQEEQAYQFDASRMPSERDVFQSNVEIQRQERSAELRVWAAEQETTIQEQARLKEMKRRVSEVEQMPWSREEKDEALSILKSGIDPLERRTARTQQKATEERLRSLEMENDQAAQMTVKKQQSQSRYLMSMGTDVDALIGQDPVFRQARERLDATEQQAVQAVRQGRGLSPQDVQMINSQRQQLEVIQQQTRQRVIDEKLRKDGGVPLWTDPNTGWKYPILWDKDGNMKIDFSGPDPSAAQRGSGEPKPVDPQRVWREAVSRVRASDPDKELKGEKFLNTVFEEYENAMRHLSTEVPGRSGQGGQRTQGTPGAGRSGSESPPPEGGEGRPTATPTAPSPEAIRGIAEMRRQALSDPAVQASEDARVLIEARVGDVERLVRQYGSFDAMPEEARQEYASSMQAIKELRDTNRYLHREDEPRRRREEIDRNRRDVEENTRGQGMMARMAYQQVANARAHLERMRQVVKDKPGDSLEQARLKGAEDNLRNAERNYERLKE